MKGKIIFIGYVVLSLFSCSKDKALLEPSPDTTIHNEIIAGGGIKSFQRIIGGTNLDGLYSVKQTIDGGYILCGFTENNEATERDVFLMRTDAFGKTIWFHNYADNYTDQGFHVEPTSGNCFIVAATTNVTAAGSNNTDYKGQLIHIDFYGNQLWKQSYSFGKYTHFSKVRQKNGGDYIAVGTDHYLNKGILLKTDPYGNELGRKIYGGLVEINDFCLLSGGGIIMCGTIKANPTSEPDIYIIRASSSGDTIWTKKYGDASYNTAVSIKETPSGNFIMCGYNINSGTSGYAKLIDNTGQEIWHSDFLAYDVKVLDNIIATYDNHFIAVGRNSLDVGNKALLQKIDNNGNNVWIKWFNPRNYNSFNEVVQTTDGGYITAGYIYGDGYIVKTDANGN
jgi:hypothetical protein